MPDENGETRYERNERFGHETATYLDVPSGLQYIWEWFWDLNQGRQRASSGYQRLSAAEYSAWQQLTDTDIRPHEFDILRRMDGAYVAAFEEEIQRMQDVEREKQKEQSQQRPKPYRTTGR